MYRLTQAGMLANNHITKHFDTYGYSPTADTAVIWSHQTRPMSLTLVVYNFGVKYVGQQHSDCLVAPLAVLYLLITKCKVKLHCGPTLNWYYNIRTVDITIPEYIL